MFDCPLCATSVSALITDHPKLEDAVCLYCAMELLGLPVKPVEAASDSQAS